MIILHYNNISMFCDKYIVITSVITSAITKVITSAITRVITRVITCMIKRAVINSFMITVVLLLLHITILRSL